MSNFIDNLAPLFDETKSYSVGDKFLYNDMLYKVKTAFSGSFDASKVKELYLSQIMGSSESSDFECIAQEWDGSESYSANDFVMHDGKLYVSIDGTSANTFIESEWKRVYLADVRKYTGFSFKTWLSKGGVTKTFTDLPSVLSDEETVRRLMTIHDSADYLVENISKNTSLLTTITTSATAMKWIGLRDYVCDNLMKVADVKTAMLSSTNWEYILKDHVPVMTSNTAPYGEVSASTTHSNASFAPYCGFLGETARSYASLSGTKSAWLQYKFTNPICIKRMSMMRVYTDAMYDKTVELVASKDGTTWTPTPLVTINSTYSSNYTENITFDNDEYYLYYRINITSDGANCNVTSLQFYGRSLNVSVPTMTSNTAPWGEVSRSSEHSNGLMSSWKAFNSSSSDYWVSGASGEQWIQYEFTKPVYIKYINIGETINSSSLVLKGSNDGTTWSNALFSFTIPTYSSYTNINGKITSDKEYKYYRVIISNSSTGWSGVKYLNFYGVDYSEREFESGSTMKYIYDHGVELEELVSNLVSSTSSYVHTGTTVKNSDNIIVTPTTSTSGYWNWYDVETKNTIDFSKYTKVFLGESLLDGVTKINQVLLDVTSLTDSEIIAISTGHNGTSKRQNGYMRTMLSGSTFPSNTKSADLFDIEGSITTTKGFVFNEWWLE